MPHTISVNRIIALLALVALTTAPALADPKSDVTTALVGLSHATSFHFNVVSHGRTVDGDVVNPGKLHLVTSPVELIVIDGTTYVKIHDAWHKFTIPGTDRMTGAISYAQDFAKTHGDLNVTDLGTKLVDGTSLHAYAVKSSGSTKPVTVYLDGSGTLVRMDTGDNDPSAITFSNFNAPVTIVAPI